MFKVIPRESSLRDDKVKMRLGFIVRLQHHERTLVTFNELVLNTTSAVSGMKFALSRDLLLCLSWQKFCQVLGSVRMTLSRRMAEGSVPRSKISLSLGPVFSQTSSSRMNVQKKLAHNISLNIQMYLQYLN